MCQLLHLPHVPATVSDELVGGVACTIESEFMESLANIASTQCGGLPELLCFCPYP